MRKLLSLLIGFVLVLSCSSDETSTPVTPPPAPIVKYTITLSAGEGGTVSTTGGEYESGQTVSVTATPQGEYVFTSWSDGNTNATRAITVSSNSTLTANFEKRKYPLTVNFEGEGEVIEEIINSGRSTDYDSGTTVKLTAQAAAEWVFIGWTGDIESTEESVQIVIGEPKEVTATFEKKKYPLSVNIEGEGDVIEEIIEAGRTTDYDSGTTVKLTAEPADEWLFKGWSGDIGEIDPTENPIQLNIIESKTVTATFEKKKYPLTVNIEGEGEVLEEIVNTGRTTDYDSGTTVKLTAVPAEGWEFVGWTGAIESTELEIQLLVSEVKEINTVFRQIFTVYNNGKIIFSQPSSLAVGSNTENHIRSNYEITKKGWLSSVINESHSGGFYGTQQIDPGYFILLHKMVLTTDLNNDGLEDMILNNVYNPHTVSINSIFKPFFALINNGDGTFNYSDYYFEDSFLRPGENSYRFIIDDFNNDGKPDFFSGMTSGPVVSHIDGSVNAGSSTPILALSSQTGIYIDASSNLNGLYPGTIDPDEVNINDGSAQYQSDRALASGDFNGDGNIDLFMFSKILYNKGNGVFNIDGSQLSDIMIPDKLYPMTQTNPYRYNTYEAYSDDFNNDGYDDIVIAPDSQFISRFGGSGWIVMSNGTNSISDWKKINLPNPIYPNNTKLNHIKSIDFNNDGFQDLVIASTRDTPYYSGVGIQLLKNNGEESFDDVTETSVSDQSHLNSYGVGGGEGTLYILDINNDGVEDVLHQTSNQDQHTNVNIYLNKNGFLELYDTSNNIPFLDWTQFIGNEIFREPSLMHNVLDFSFPINVNNKGWVDFISLEAEISPFAKRNVFYTIESKSN